MFPFPSPNAAASRRRGLRVVRDADGVPVRYRAAKEYHMEQETGHRKRINDQLQRRNGIPLPSKGSDNLIATPEYNVNFFNNRVHGGGLIPGSNFGLASSSQAQQTNKNIFGRPIGKGAGKSGKNRVPTILLDCIGLLCESECLNDSTLFQFLPPLAPYESYNGLRSSIKHSHPELAKQFVMLRRKYDSGKSVSMVDCGIDPRIASVLMYSYLIELNPPLLTYDLYEKFMNTQALAGTIDAEEKIVATTRMLILTLPALNRRTLGTLVAYWRDLLLRSSSNKLTVEKIAGLYGTVLLRHDPHTPYFDPILTEQDKRNIPRNILKLIIERSSDLFPVSDLVGVSELKAQIKIPFETKRVIMQQLEEKSAVSNLRRWEVKAFATNSESCSAEVDSDDEGTVIGNGGESGDEASFRMIALIDEDVEATLKELKQLCFKSPANTNHSSSTSFKHTQTHTHSHIHIP